MDQKQEHRQNYFFKDFLIGGVSAALAKTIVAPLDFFRSSTVNGIKPHQIIKEQGYVIIWRNNARNALRLATTQSFNFAFKDYFERKFLSDRKNSSYLRFLTGNILAGSLAGIISLVIVYPFDLVLTHYDMDLRRFQKTGQRMFKKPTDIVKHQFEAYYAATGNKWTSGLITLFALYRGFWISVAGITIYRGLYFGLYDSTKPLLPGSLKNNFFINLVLAYAITAFATLGSYPLDTVRRRTIMAQSEQNRNYSNVFQCAKYILNKEGIRSFWQGGASTVMRAPIGAATLAIYDQFQKYLCDRITQ